MRLVYDSSHCPSFSSSSPPASDTAGDSHVLLKGGRSGDRIESATDSAATAATSGVDSDADIGSGGSCVLSATGVEGLARGSAGRGVAGTPTDCGSAGSGVASILADGGSEGNGVDSAVDGGSAGKGVAGLSAPVVFAARFSLILPAFLANFARNLRSSPGDFFDSVDTVVAAGGEVGAGVDSAAGSSVGTGGAVGAGGDATALRGGAIGLDGDPSGSGSGGVGDVRRLLDTSAAVGAAGGGGDDGVPSAAAEANADAARSALMATAFFLNFDRNFLSSAGVFVLSELVRVPLSGSAVGAGAGGSGGDALRGLSGFDGDGAVAVAAASS